MRREEGVRGTILIMTTDNNKRPLEVAGLLTEEVKGASANDLAIAIVAISDDIAEKTMQKAEQLPRNKPSNAASSSWRWSTSPRPPTALTTTPISSQAGYASGP
jgi:hypothetical protein